MFHRLLAAALLTSGCVTWQAGPKDTSPTDKDAQLVEKRLAAKVPASLERHTHIKGWVRDRRGHGMSSGRNGTEWHVHFAVMEKPGDENNPHRLPTSAYAEILTPIRADVLAAVESTGVEVTSASAVEFRDGDTPRARFEIRYLRLNRTVAGEVVGVVELATRSSGPDTRYTDARVTQREWVCK